MARKKKEEVKAGSPEWMTTFSDLMNLLLCFFVLLFSMSTVDAEKFEMIATSLQNSFSIFEFGGSVIGDASMIGAGVSQLEDLDIYYKEANSEAEKDTKADTTEAGEGDIKEQFMEASLKESEEMAEKIEDALNKSGIGDKVELDVNAQYVKLTLNGALLFDSGKAEIREDALQLVDKLGKVVELYAGNMVSIEGHTDNVPISSTKYEDNDVLSAYRALAVKEYFLEHTQLDPGKIRATSCGEYAPVADNGSAEGRALNRRVEVKIYNALNSN